MLKETNLLFCTLLRSNISLVALRVFQEGQNNCSPSANSRYGETCNREMKQGSKLVAEQ